MVCLFSVGNNWHELLAGISLRIQSVILRFSKSGNLEMYCLWSPTITFLQSWSVYLCTLSSLCAQKKRYKTITGMVSFRTLSFCTFLSDRVSVYCYIQSEYLKWSIKMKCNLYLYLFTILHVCVYNSTRQYHSSQPVSLD